MLWFFGDFIDVSIYMADGRFLKLSLIFGMGIKAHDQLNLFSHFDLWGIDQMLSSMLVYLDWAGLFWYGPGYAKVGEATIKKNEVDG